MTDNKMKPANTVTKYEVTTKDLPLACPMDNQTLWNAHPKVYLPIEKTGKAKCPYCGIDYTLKSRQEQQCKDNILLEYKGFQARFEYLRELGMYAAEIDNGCDTIAFSAVNFKELSLLMKDAVENYLTYQSKKLDVLSNQSLEPAPN